jgi:SAM-dependent methyltransferase
MTTLTTTQARRFYDRMGRLQDAQAVYEDRAITHLFAHAGFERATGVVELGCGTGRVARRLLRCHLAPTATYLGMDVSPTMVRIAGARLRPWAARATILLGDITEGVPGADGSADRVLSTYVLDLLDDAATDRVLHEAHRLLSPDGLLCLVSLTDGADGLARRASDAWEAVWRRWPGLVGGCRPVHLADRLRADEWRVRHDEVVTAFGLSSEVLVAAACTGGQ